MRHHRATRPRIENGYPWRRPVDQAVQELADCGWTTEAREIAVELNGLPEQTDPIDWEQPGALASQLDEIRARAERRLENLDDLP